MFGDRRLTKHTIATIKVVDFDLCEMQCYKQPNCVSINFNVISDSEGLHECELNNATHQSHDHDLQNKKGYVYKGAEVRNFSIPFGFVFHVFFFSFCIRIWRLRLGSCSSRIWSLSSLVSCSCWQWCDEVYVRARSWICVSVEFSLNVGSIVVSDSCST